MRVLSLSTFDERGGAARSAYRLHQGLCSMEVDSTLLVRDKSSVDPSVMRAAPNLQSLAAFNLRLSGITDRQPMRLYRNYSPQFPWSLNVFPNNIVDQVRGLEPELIHLHWIGNGFVPAKALSQLKLPIIWTLHDSWAFTGGCHIPYDCTGYKKDCGHCPQLGSGREHDLSHWMLSQKKKYWSDINLTIVTPSRWLAGCARASSLFAERRIEVIPYGLDLNTYRPVDKQLARRLLNLPSDKKLILFGSVNSTGDRNKGFHLLLPALQHLASNGWRESAELVIFGASAGKHNPDLALKSHYLGYLHDDVSLALMYSAADVFVAPSMQENLPNTVIEALACGTPSVGFSIGGIPDLIDHQENGYLARPYEADDLANGIAWVIEDEERWQKLAAHAREEVVHKFELRAITRRYLHLYQEILAAAGDTNATY